MPVATHKLLSAMFEHTATMLKVAYNPKPSATDIVNASQATSNLRKILHALQAKGTQLLQQANKHQLLSQNQLNMVGSEIGCMHCIHCTQCLRTCFSIHTHVEIFCV